MKKKKMIDFFWPSSRVKLIFLDIRGPKKYTFWPVSCVQPIDLDTVESVNDSLGALSIVRPIDLDRGGGQIMKFFQSQNPTNHTYV